MKVNVHETEFWPLYIVRSAEGPGDNSPRYVELPDELVERHAKAKEALEQAQEEIRGLLLDANYRM